MALLDSVAMRIALASMIPLLLGCSESNPDFAVSQWEDGVEVTMPPSESLQPAVGSTAPGLWAKSTAQARDGENSWHFGTGMTFPTLANASLRSPEFEAGRQSFLRFSYWSDIPTLSATTGTDGMVVEGQIENGDWVQLELNGGYPYVLDETALGSSLSLGNGMIAGTDREWVDDWVELPDAEPGQPIRFRFRFGGDIEEGNNMGEGIYIDAAEFLIVE